MSKRTPGTKATQKAGAIQHKKEKARHREKLQRRYDRYCEAIKKENTPGVLAAPFDVWLSWDKANSNKGHSLSDMLTNVMNEMGVLNEKEDK